MMSNGPWSVAAVVPQRLRARPRPRRPPRRTAGRGRGGSPRAAGRAASAAARGLLAAHDVRRRSRGRRARGCAPGRALRQVEHDRDRQHVVLARQLDSGLRASGCTLVASTTVSRPARQPLAGDEVQHVEGVGRSPPGRSRRRRPAPGRRRTTATSVGRKCCARERRLAGAGRADSTRGENRGWSRSRGLAAHRRVNTAIWVGAPTSASSRPTRHEAHRVAEARGDAVGPGAELGAGPLEAVVAVAQRRRPAASRSARCTRGSAWSRRPSPGRAHSNSDPLERRQPRRVEVLDHLDHAAASKPARRRSR